MRRMGFIVFQSTHPRGVRQELTGQQGDNITFQSTHPRGVRLVHGQTQEPGICSFNPRTRVGCDQVMDDWVTYQDAFQSTHPRGVRQARQMGR